MKILLSLLFAFVSCLACAGEAPHSYWNPAIAAFEASDRVNPPPQGAVLFIGSSSIEHWKSVAADFPEVKVINRGFGGSELGDSTYFADRIVAPYHPRAIVLYAGDNDLYYGHTPQQVRDDFAAFVSKVRSLDPGVAIAFVSIKPSVARQSLLPQIKQANELIRAYAATQKNVTYVDTFTPMLGADGQPQQKWFGPDGLHMNRSGYALWIGILKPWVDAHAS
jgi:lysophospholipase L1-like esterase